MLFRSTLFIALLVLVFVLLPGAAVIASDDGPVIIEGMYWQVDGEDDADTTSVTEEDSASAVAPNLNDLPFASLPENENFYAEQEAWAVGSLLAAAALAMGLTTGISFAKNLVLRPIRGTGLFGTSSTGETAYSLLLLLTVFVVAVIGVIQAGFNPFESAPYEKLTLWEEWLQVGWTAVIVTLFAVIEHEGFVSYLESRNPRLADLL